MTLQEKGHNEEEADLARLFPGETTGDKDADADKDDVEYDHDSDQHEESPMDSAAARKWKNSGDRLVNSSVWTETSR